MIEEEEQEQLLSSLASEKIGDSPIKSDMKCGPHKHLGAESQSEGTIQLVPKSRKMVIITPRRPWRNMRRSARGNLVQ